MAIDPAAPASASSSLRARRMGLAGLALVLLLAAWLYAPVLRYDFVMFDDDVNIYGNPHLGEITWARLHWACTGFDYMPRVMPVAWLLLMAIFQVAGMDPAAFHAYNLAMHLVNAVLVYALAGRMLRLAARSRGREPSPGWAAFLPWAAAAAWALHPLRSESIAWATGWIYPSVTFFALAAGWLALLRLDASGRRRRCLWAGAAACYLLSVLVYPVSLGFPAALLAFEWWLGRGARTAETARSEAWRLARSHAFFWLLAALVLGGNVWARVWKNRFYPPAPTMAEFTLEHRVTQAARSLAYYPVRMAWPGETSPVYELRAPDKLLTPGGAYCVAGLGLAAVWAWGRRRTSPGWLAWAAAYAGVAAPFSGFLDYPFQTSDRYGYFPGVVVVLGLALAARDLGATRARLALGAGTACWVAWLAASVPAQLPKWRDSEALFAAVRETLAAPEGRAAYGTSWAMYRARRGDFSGAHELMGRLAEEGATPGQLAGRRFNIETMERLARSATTIPTARGLIAPDAILAYHFALRDVRAGEWRGARFRYLQVLAADPDFHDARYNFALWLASIGRTDEARAQYAELERRAGARLPAGPAGRLRSLIETSADPAGARTLAREARP